MNSTRIRIPVEQAMNEVIDFFLLLSSASVSSEQHHQHIKGIKFYVPLQKKIKHKVSITCSTYL